MENNKTGLWLLGSLVTISVIATLIMVIYSKPANNKSLGAQQYYDAPLFSTPAQQFAQARNTQRSANINAILNAVGQLQADNRGTWVCSAGPLPATPTKMSSRPGGYNIAPCLVSAYLPTMPVDPMTGFYSSVDDYRSEYTIMETNGLITVNAPDAELGTTVMIIR